MKLTEEITRLAEGYCVLFEQYTTDKTKLSQLEIGLLTKLSYGAKADDLTEKEKSHLLELANNY